MRVWEFQENKSADLVLEQDFILRVRRMQRQGTPCLVLNFVLNAIEALTKNRETFEATQKKLQEFALETKGSYYQMSNGDCFIAWDEPRDAQMLQGRAIESALSDHGHNRQQFLLIYRMPENYAPLRERANHYVETARAAAAVGDGFDQVENTHGKLTAKNVDQIEQLLGEIDLRRYGRTQPLYCFAKDRWTPVGEEYFISFDDLRRERFPKLEVVSSAHFFLALCGVLDQRLLTMLTSFYEIIGGRPINLNVSISSIMGTEFAQFVHRVPHEHRPLIGFELNRGDWLQDFALTLSAIDVLKREGFRVILDGVTPDMVNYVNLGMFTVDAIKINVSKDRALQLTNPSIHAGMKKLPAEKLVFFRCDNERALAFGQELGVSLFQGWLIDDLAGKKS
jgi:hypothetical protein